MIKKNLLRIMRASVHRNKGLSLSAKNCKIDKVPLSILETMFENAASLNQTDGLVIPKPGSSDSLYVVAGT